MISTKTGRLSFLLLLILSTFFASFASALTAKEVSGNVESFIDGAVEILHVPLLLLLGDTDTASSFTTEEIIIKLLVFLIVLVVVSRVVKNIPVFQGGFLSFVIAFFVATLTVRFITSSELIEFIWLPQALLGVLLVTLLPFIIYWYFMNSFSGNRTIRTVGWISFAVLYVGLAYLRWDELETSRFNLGWIYLAIGILSFVMIKWGRGIDNWLEQGKHIDLNNASIHRSIGNLESKKRKILAEMTEYPADSEAMKGAQKEIEEINKTIARLNKSLE